MKHGSVAMFTLAVMGFVCPLGVPQASAQTAAPPTPTPEPYVPVDPIPPGNEANAPLVPANQPPPPPPPPTTAELVDYAQAFDRLGQRMPDGSGVAVGIVEGNPGAYGPDPLNPAFRGLDVTLHSGPSTVSGHANKVAETMVGQRGLAPKPTALGSWSVNHWLTNGFLQLGTPHAPGLPIDLGDATPRVWSHSWIGSDAARASPVLRRLDSAIDAQGLIVCVGVNNGKDSTVPPMLGSAYNAIAVGADAGNSSGGFTQIETAGRCKPDLVAPGGMTSFSTPAVAGVAVLLLDYADDIADANPQAVHATRPEVIKAALMAGAQKHHSWSRQPDRPLDERLGAGRVNLDASLRILDGGPIAPGQRITRGKGWAYADLPPRTTHRYTLQAPRDLGEFSVVLTWHRRIDGRSLVTENQANGDRRALFHSEPRLADLDLHLTRIDDDDQPIEPVQLSTSRIDNVEHVHLPALPQGRYILEVVRDPTHDPVRTEAWTYGLAWRLEMPAAP